MKRIHLLLASGLAALALVAAGCGDDDEESGDDAAAPAQTQPAETAPEQAAPSRQTSTLNISAVESGEFKFGATELDAKAGKVTINMDNPSSVPHAVAIRGDGVDEEGKTVTKGGESSVTAELQPGEYEFYCPVPGHEEGGMKGTLTVE